MNTLREHIGRHMDVEGLGMMRIAEHFTVADGRIKRIRQVHDTAALRAAGFGGKK